MSVVDVFDFRFQEDDMILDKVQDVMVADSLATSHPVFMPADTPAQISAIFDSITYDKVSARSSPCIAIGHGTLCDYWYKHKLIL